MQMHVCAFGCVEYMRDQPLIPARLLSRVDQRLRER